MKRSTTPPKRVLAELVNGVEEIVNEFGWAGFSEDGDEVARPEEANGADTAEDEPESEEYEPRRSRFPREDIEIGIDRFNSLLIKAKIVKKQKTGRQPSLWQVFATLYGEDHPILEVIDRFEDHIKGYFGFVEYEQMRAAFDDILEVRDSVKKDLEGANV
jgi:hypothetical protein